MPEFTLGWRPPEDRSHERRYALAEAMPTVPTPVVMLKSVQQHEVTGALLVTAAGLAPRVGGSVMRRESNPPDSPLSESVPFKTCTQCDQAKPATEYYRRKAECKACSSARAVAWAKGHPDQIKAAKDRNQDAIREQQRDRYYRRAQDEDYKKQNRERAAKWREQNRERHRAYSKWWRLAHPEQERERARRDEAMRRLGRNSEAIAFSKLLLLDPCSYCGTYDNITIDHIVPVSAGGANTADNLTAACLSCNSRKRTRSALTFLIKVASQDV